MNFDQFQDIDNQQSKKLFAALLKPRMIEEKMLKLLRQGQVSKWFSGIGQEAISVGATMALESDEYIMPLHRNLGVFTTRGIPLKKLLHQWQGNAEGFTKGRDRSFHFGSTEYHIAGMISHLGAMLSVADGVALANKLDGKHKVTLAFSGDGGTSEGEFHEALNLAAVWDLPVIFLAENNGYGLSTPSADQFRCKNLSDKGIGYGIESKTIDGNNVLEVYSEVDRIAKDLRMNPRPFLLECKTFRMRGHEEASGTKYVPKDLMDEWAKKDPILNFERYIVENKIITSREISQIKESISAEISEGVKILSKIEKINVNTQTELRDVYKSYSPLSIKASDSVSEMRFIDAIKDGLQIAMRKYDNLVLMGQDIAEYGGVFKITEGFVAEFGKQRVLNTPISEAAPLGAALGLSLGGKKAMVEMQFADFVSCGFNQIANNLAKTHYRWGQNSDVVVRMPTGGGAAAGPFHSQSNEAWFFNIPGLKIVYPSNPKDAKGLLLASFEDPNPVLYFEHKGLYRSIKEEVCTDEYTCEIGKANVVDNGEDITFISYGWAVHWCKELIDEMSLDATLVDLRTLVPWDKEAVREAVKTSGKVIIVHEDTLSGGIGGEIASWIGEHCFKYLDAPVMRVGSLETPIPFNGELEQNFLGKVRLKEKVEEILRW
ncbi:dehydrogenase E1 component subunit alpha/beta [Bacteroidia bacterium]|nr:dehydrogenase E1 component subunit alpha/beta [Bacteroidia bacterium]MDB4107262.1 dehydrogenase E1 component subunit alpha/beta [Bacteroidia bacterium]MDB9882421.1 dehydrogenase E1 component subunit alpha/beta [Bacteroidia bacterium]